MVKQYEINHCDGNMSYNIDGNTFDVYAISEKGSDKELCSIRFSWLDEGQPSYVITRHCFLNGISSDEHLLASFMMSLIKGFTEDHSFYFEQFYNEDGKRISLPFTVL